MVDLQQNVSYNEIVVKTTTFCGIKAPITQQKNFRWVKYIGKNGGKHMKKLFGIILAVVMLISVFALTACNQQIPDEMTSEDGKYEIAMITDIGDLKDGSFNEGTWEGVKTYAYENGKSYKYYQPANGSNATDTDRVNAFKLAISNGAKVIVCPGFAFGNALAEVVPANPEVKFIFIDGWTMGFDNLVGIAFQEEQCGYLAGYAAVMEGYTKLGGTFGGGATNAACNRYAFGYIQGINAAAKELNKTVEVKVSHQYGAGFSASSELQTQIAGWYNAGTEIVFACGGSMFTSVASAAAEANKKVIGVDVDQSTQSSTVVTSAMKGLKEAAMYALDTFYAGKWDSDLADKFISLGAKDNAVGLPTATWSMKNYKVSDYEALLGKIKAGTVSIDNDADWTSIATKAAGLSNINFLYE